MPDPARGDLGRLSAEEWVSRHAERLLTQSERSMDFVDALIIARDVFQILEVALEAFKALTGWPKVLPASWRRWDAARGLADRVERCVTAFFGAATDAVAGRAEMARARMESFRAPTGRDRMNQAEQLVEIERLIADLRRRHREPVASSAEEAAEEDAAPKEPVN
jgi:hypothetical protein